MVVVIKLGEEVLVRFPPSGAKEDNVRQPSALLLIRNTREL
jgi:hypothetical protein